MTNNSIVTMNHPYLLMVYSNALGSHRSQPPIFPFYLYTKLDLILKLSTAGATRLYDLITFSWPSATPRTRNNTLHEL